MISKIFMTALKFGFVTLLIAAVLAFLSAPVFLGVVLITASVVMTVYIYGAIAFVVGGFYRWLTLRNDAKNNNS